METITGYKHEGTARRQGIQKSRVLDGHWLTRPYCRGVRMLPDQTWALVYWKYRDLTSNVTDAILCHRGGIVYGLEHVEAALGCKVISGAVS